MSTSIRIAALLAGLAFPLPAAALCALCTCTVSTTNIAFGAYDPTAPTADDVNGNISISCTGLLALSGTIDVTLSPGVSGTALARQLRKGSNQLNYNLYTDVARTIVWGDGTGGTSKVTSTVPLGVLSFTNSVPVYGRIPARQWVAAGAYTDSVVITITY
ncbi:MULTISPECIES: spore coat U domain-containing protein [Sphingomonas]|uniref:Csu type fimbrial protein n=1 Tax=Sphingomonas TaxID=13687 RepID=UPI00092C17FB|nr:MULTISPECIES: spore coat U domain-containing protein [Sphingomonas]MCW6530448.1 spore coat U domain-containing protein [Sphingomonas lycopersici]OJU17832.1 MAG: hypothetical protein BGN95_16250 [Sphingomonas sp. 66-10]